MKEIDIMADSAEYVWAMPFDRRSLRHVLRTMLLAAEEKGISIPERLEVRLVNDRDMRAANSRFAGCPGPTNVLAFPGGSDMPGIILMSSGAVLRECLLHGQRPDEYTLLLLAHGLAHLAGLEHGSCMDRICDVCVAAVRRTLNPRLSP
ncbi:MAG: rRNA maturation RNAse YbeY [Desulfovibrio sp.]|jgi:probable rRNA maturation factor|nr:rRNA maturation RNAse YbeY [Desulfovibrio sp.]